jgi:hypothetical protein
VSFEIGSGHKKAQRWAKIRTYLKVQLEEENAMLKLH